MIITINIIMGRREGGTRTFRGALKGGAPEGGAPKGRMGGPADGWSGGGAVRGRENLEDTTHTTHTTHPILAKTLRTLGQMRFGQTRSRK